MPAASIERISRTSSAGEADDGNADRDVETEGAGRQSPVDEHHRGAGGRRFFDGLLGEPPSREQRGPPGDRAGPVLGEETRDAPRGRGAADREPPRR